MLARLLVAAALAAVVLTPVASSAEPAPPRAPYLLRDGHTWTVHDGTTTVTLPDSIVDNGQEMPPQYGVFRLLGRVDAGYVLVELVGPTAYDGGLTELDLHLLHPDGTADTFLALDGRAVGQRVRLSDDGRAVWVLHDDARAGLDQSLLVGLDGSVTALPDRRRHVLDVPTTTSVVFARTGRRAGVYRSDLVRGRPTRLTDGPGARLADVRDDVLVRRVHGATLVGRLSQPHRVRWSSSLAPIASDGRLVLLQGASLELRRVRDGALVTTLGTGDLGDPTQVVFEDADHLLLTDGERVVRCGVDGACEVALDPADPITVTLPGATGPRWPGSPA